MTLNGKQLAAVMKAALIASKADGNTSEEELNVIVKEMASFKMTSDQFSGIYDIADAMSVDEMVEELKRLDYSTQKYIKGFLVAVVAVDGRLTDEEIQAWDAICSLCEFPSVSPEEALLYWRNN